MNKINSDGWVAINCIPTAVHTIAGALTGKLLQSGRKNKIQPMLMWAVICLVVGFGLDYAHITPIIKRIATSSFTMASLGWCLLGLAFCYWWIDIKNHRNGLKFWTVIGINSIFIYLFNEIVGSRWFVGYITEIATGVMSWISTPEMLSAIIASICVFAVEWGICYFLYKKKVFFKL